MWRIRIIKDKPFVCQIHVYIMWVALFVVRDMNLYKERCKPSMPPQQQPWPPIFWYTWSPGFFATQYQAYLLVLTNTIVPHPLHSNVSTHVQYIPRTCTLSPFYLSRLLHCHQSHDEGHNLSKQPWRTWRQTEQVKLIGIHIMCISYGLWCSYQKP